MTVFTKNRERLLAGDIAARYPSAVMGQSRVKALLSDEDFSVDGTLIEAWANMKILRPKDGVGLATTTTIAAATRAKAPR